MAEGRENPQIYAPERLTPPERARDTFITAVMWTFYLYLWVPFLSLLGWLMGFELAYDIMIRSGGALDNATTFFAYAIVVGIIFCAVTGWSTLNRLRFRGVDRRRSSQRVGDQAAADYFNVTLDQLRELRSGKIFTVEVDESGQLMSFSADEDTGHSSA